MYGLIFQESLTEHSNEELIGELAGISGLRDFPDTARSAFLSDKAYANAAGDLLSRFVAMLAVDNKSALKPVSAVGVY